MCAYFGVLICIFHLYISVYIWRSKYSSLSSFGCTELARLWGSGCPFFFSPSLLHLFFFSPVYNSSPYVLWNLKIVLQSYIVSLLQWNLTIWACQQRDLSRSLDIRYKFLAVLAFQRLPRSRQQWRLQWDQGLGKYLTVYWVISWHRYKPWQN